MYYVWFVILPPITIDWIVAPFALHLLFGNQVEGRNTTHAETGVCIKFFAWGFDLYLCYQGQK
jgi:hypothetical protein